MDVRGKLVELLNEIVAIQECGFGDPRPTYETVASYLISHGVTVIPPEGIGEMSDGYHTFNELYHHRAVLFSVICNAMPDKAWKSKRHDTGDMYDGMFIVGIETNHGQATYHYDVDPYWDMFNVPELEYAPKWDGHTPQEAINRIANGVTVQEWISVDDRLPEKNGCYIVTACDEGCSCDEGIWYDTVVIEAEHYKGEWSWNENGTEYDITCFVTHWQPMPQPPKGE